ncbi:hypothetical protein Ac2012v2_002417 [Leucoagaricus gongylophorus]
MVHTLKLQTIFDLQLVLRSRFVPPVTICPSDLQAKLMVFMSVDYQWTRRFAAAK